MLLVLRACFSDGDGSDQCLIALAVIGFLYDVIISGVMYRWVGVSSEIAFLYR